MDSFEETGSLDRTSSRSASKEPESDQPPKKPARTLLETAVLMIITAVVLYFTNFLPDGADQWYRWFFGEGQLYLSAPFETGRIAVILWCLVIGWLYRYFRPKAGKPEGREKLPEESRDPID